MWKGRRVGRGPSRLELEIKIGESISIENMIGSEIKPGQAGVINNAW